MLVTVKLVPIKGLTSDLVVNYFLCGLDNKREEAYGSVWPHLVVVVAAKQDLISLILDFPRNRASWNHRSSTRRCIGSAGHLNRCSVSCGDVLHRGQQCAIAWSILRIKWLIRADIDSSDHLPGLGTKSTLVFLYALLKLAKLGLALNRWVRLKSSSLCRITGIITPPVVTLTGWTTSRLNWRSRCQIFLR